MSQVDSKPKKILKVIAAVVVAVSLISTMIGYLYLDSLAFDESGPPDSVGAEP